MLLGSLSRAPRSRGAIAALVIGLWLAARAAQAASPSFAYVYPFGGQRGTELDVTLNGARLEDAKEVLFHRPGISVEKLEVVNGGQVKARFKIAADAPPGEYPLRLRCASGVTELHSFYVGPYPAVAEAEPNSEFVKPQKIPMNVTVAGVVENEDVDYFLVEAKQGERISAEVEGMRLGHTLFDPFVAILDMGRFELASGDDSALAMQDGFASIVAPKDGTYVIAVRESAYGGNGSCHYRLHVGGFPRPTVVFPMAGRAGEEAALKFLGDPKGPIDLKVKLPASPMETFFLHATEGGQIAPSPNRFRVTDYPSAIEVEPNNDVASATKIDASLPLLFHGVIGEKGDVDFFRFAAKKGQVFDFHVYARRLRSPLDPVLVVHNAAGAGIVGNDDAVGPDSYLRFTAPEDGEYLFQVTDHLRAGGADFVYCVEAAPPRASLNLYVPPLAVGSQERMTVAVPKGNRYCLLLAANRVNFGGELVLASPDLPPGVAMASENMQANLNVVPVVFEAAADAPVGGKLADVLARHADPNQKIEGRFDQHLDITIGPNQTVFYRTPIDRLAVAVTEEVPFKISIVEPKAPLVQDGSMNLKIVAERKGDFKGPITLYFPFAPPGVGAAGSAVIPEGQNETVYPLNANGGAQVRTWKIAVIGHATVGNGPVWVSTQLANLTIAPPFVGLAIQMAAAEQGKPTEVVCKMTTNTPFEGKATAKLLGLPAKVTTKDLEVTKDQAEVVFPVTIDATSPVGQHKTLFCQLTVMKDGEPVLHNLSYGGTLRIDPPPPPKANEPAAPAEKPAEPAKVPEKRLTRLEQLRLEQAERVKAAQAAAQKAAAEAAAQKDAAEKPAAPEKAAEKAPGK